MPRHIAVMSRVHLAWIIAICTCGWSIWKPMLLRLRSIWGFALMWVTSMHPRVIRIIAHITHLMYAITLRGYVQMISHDLSMCFRIPKPTVWSNMKTPPRRATFPGSFVWFS